MTRPLSTSRWSLPLVTLSLAACLDGSSDPGSVRGELGNGTFQYTCDSSTRACRDGHATVFPERIAVDTRFDLSFEPRLGTARTGSLEPASDRLLEIRDTGWRALEIGTAGILQVRQDRALEDYTFVTLETAAAIDLFVGRSTTPGASPGSSTEERLTWDAVASAVELAEGQSLPLIVEPVDGAGRALAGEALIELQCDRAGVATLTRPTRRPARFALTAEGTGTTMCTLQALGFARRFDVNVAEGPVIEPDAGVDPDASTDAGAPDGDTQ